ncbi:DUF4245 domain-containing protein [Nesterenkonia marinintestina]|uniref:DUF4245 domain-containing protein n=1 Tax=Nesterenkonia marinintestina TaxID=2979865 RepID=UPI0021C0714E|nr:DUF4245 domain-containing protein [Nesterenkonia sp. GX14115]
MSESRTPESEEPVDRPSSAPSERARAEDEQPTPQLTEAQSKRLRQPLVGMVITVAVTFGAVAAFLMMNPEPTPDENPRDEDVVSEAYFAAGIAEFTPIAPEVADGWTANYARWESSGEHGVPVWEAGYTTDDVSFFGFAQTDQGNPTWVGSEVSGAASTGTAVFEDMEFETYESDDERRYFVLWGDDNDVDGTTVVITTDASEEEVDSGMEALVESIGQEVELDGDEDGTADGEDAVESEVPEED